MNFGKLGGLFLLILAAYLPFGFGVEGALNISKGRQIIEITPSKKTLAFTADQTAVEKQRAIQQEMVYGALINACNQVTDVISTQDKIEKKKKKKLLPWTLLTTALSFAAQALCNRSKTSDDNMIENVSRVCEDLRSVLLVDNRCLFCGMGPSSLETIFAIPEENDRKNAIREKMLSDNTRIPFLQEIFSVLFSYFSDKLADIHEYFDHQLHEKILSYYSAPQKIEENNQIVKEFGLFATWGEVAADIYANAEVKKSFLSDDSLTPIITLFAQEYELISTPFTRALCEERIVGFVELLHSYIAQEESLAAFERKWSMLSQLNDASSIEARATVIRSFLQTEKDVKTLLDEVTLHLHLYLQEKLTSLFSEIFSCIAG